MLSTNNNLLKSNPVGQKILVTGGAGYIGSHLVQTLLSSGYQPVVYDDFSAGSLQNIPSGVKVIKGDILDQTVLNNVLKAKDYLAVMHLAALVNAAESVLKETEYLKVDRDGTNYVLQAALNNKVKNFLFASSAAVYGNEVGSFPVKEDYPLHPVSPYGIAKLESELLLKKSGINYGIFRFFNVIGSNNEGTLGSNPDNRAILTRMFAVASGTVPKLVISGGDYETVDGTVLRDFVHVLDITRAFIMGLTHLIEGGQSFLCNLGSGRVTSLQELKSVVEQVTGVSIEVEYAARNPGDIIYSEADINCAKNILGWEPEHDLTSMVESAWRYYEKNYLQK